VFSIIHCRDRNEGLLLMDNRQTLALGIGAVCVALLVGWGLISLGSGNGAQSQRSAMAAAPSTVGLGSSAGADVRSSKATPRRRTKAKRAQVRQAKSAAAVQADPSSLANRRGNPRLP
jgi:hypothetical protein